MTAHGFDVVEAVGTGPELERALRSHRPDVSVVDVRMPPTLTDEGLQVSLAVRRDIPGLPILVLSQHVEQLYARELLADGAGAIGYLLKDRVFNADQFIDAVRRVAGGGTAMDPEVIAKLVAGNASDPLAALTPREREVLELMAEGCSNAAIAGRLHFSEGAVGKHTANIFAKLGIVASDDTNRRVLAVLAYLGSGES
ncbi:putative two-component system response regulator [Amycolatopsis azurea DSM 43854]|uniref:Putative two-component system response regulator n=1 Tax=Amycolatopsis azurea DSM 43854 TaxID=1238180 RepID=M2PZC3_9PSEU|nr:putative two-component system response regulator [Amycolatopsis azurea DSM 43854]